MSTRIFDTPAPRLFTIPPDEDFLAAVAQTLRDEFRADENPDALTGVLLLTPTRRAARALGDAFARSAGEGAALLPNIRPIGDVDVDDPPFEPGELAELAPPAISQARRRFELARLVLAKEAALDRPLGVGGALTLAEPLGALLDDLATEDSLDLSVLREALHDILPADRQEAVEFLEIVQTVWPQRLQELGLIDPAERRTRVLDALVDRWSEHPPDHPVLVVGSTGSIPAARRVMKQVASLEQGAVVLPGFDWDADETAWQGIDDAHPQWAMKAFLDGLGLDRSEVSAWPGSAESPPARARRRVIAEALRPAEATDGWLPRLDRLREELGEGFFERGLDGLSLVEASDDISEARCCALALREVLETPGKTAILVTPDRSLARRVSAEMQRFGVRLDDSAGGSLAQTRAGALASRLLDAVETPGSVVALSALWASPLFTLGGDRGVVHTVLAKFEAEALRGCRPGHTVAAIRARLDGKHVDLFPDDRALIETILIGYDAAIADLDPVARLPMSAWAERHVRACEALAADAKTPGDVRLWLAAGGSALAEFFRSLMTESRAMPDMSLADYAAAFREMLQAAHEPASMGLHPRLQMLGPLEARLIRADRVILAGLNEGVWPAGLGSDPWLSRGMRLAVNLGAPERRHGLAAHDFAQLAGGGEVLLSRALKTDGTPTIASRWVWRLKTLAEGALGSDGAAQALKPATDYASLARRMDQARHEPSPAPPPRPCPPVEARPRRLSITEIRTWVRDPYAIYARHVLGLRPLDPADMPPGPRERGTALHDVLHAAFEDWRTVLPDDAEDQLVERAQDALLGTGFQPADLPAELLRFRRASRWLLRWERARRERGYTIATLEARARLSLETPAGDWVLTGRIDRIDRSPDGMLDIIDYKTGRAASPKEVRAGFDPQLPLSAAMAEDGAGMDTLDPAAAQALLYLSLPGNEAGGLERRIDGQKVRGGDPTPAAAEMAQTALEDLRQWIARFDDAATPYPSQPRVQYVDEYGQYDHLARRSEWASAPGEGGEE